MGISVLEGLVETDLLHEVLNSCLNFLNGPLVIEKTSPVIDVEWLGNDRADRHSGVKGCHGNLEDHLDILPEAEQCLLIGLTEVNTLENDLTVSGLVKL